LHGRENGNDQQALEEELIDGFDPAFVGQIVGRVFEHNPVAGLESEAHARRYSAK